MLNKIRCFLAGHDWKYHNYKIDNKDDLTVVMVVEREE